jgi:hypothetical protein
MKDINEYYEERIKNTVHMENEIRKTLNVIAPSIKRRLKELLNTKIVKVDGNPTLKMAQILEDTILPTIAPINNHHVNKWQIYYKIYSDTIYLEVRYCFNGGNYEDHSYYCIYYDGNTLIGTKDKDGILRDVPDYEQKELLNYDQQRADFFKHQELKKQAEEQEKKIFYGIKERNQYK